MKMPLMKAMSPNAISQREQAEEHPRLLGRAGEAAAVDLLAGIAASWAPGSR